MSNGPIARSSRLPTIRPSFARNGRASASSSRRRSPAFIKSPTSKRLDVQRPCRRCASPETVGSCPGARGLRPLLEAFDLVLLNHGEPDIVEPVEQAMLAVRIDVELHHAAVGTPDLLLRKIDRQRRIGAALGIVEQLLQILRLDLDRQHAVLEAVVV